MFKTDELKREKGTGESSMIPKIIDMLSGTVIFASAIAAVPVAIYNPYGPAFAAWILMVMLSGQWLLWRYWTDWMEDDQEEENE